MNGAGVMELDVYLKVINQEKLHQVNCQTIIQW